MDIVNIVIGILLIAVLVLIVIYIFGGKEAFENLFGFLKSEDKEGEV